MAAPERRGGTGSKAEVWAPLLVLLLLGLALGIFLADRRRKRLRHAQRAILVPFADLNSFAKRPGSMGPSSLGPALKGAGLHAEPKSSVWEMEGPNMRVSRMSSGQFHNPLAALAEAEGPEGEDAVQMEANPLHGEGVNIVPLDLAEEAEFDLEDVEAGDVVTVALDLVESATTEFDALAGGAMVEEDQQAWQEEMEKLRGNIKEMQSSADADYQSVEMQALATETAAAMARIQALLEKQKNSQKERERRIVAEINSLLKRSQKDLKYGHKILSGGSASAGFTESKESKVSYILDQVVEVCQRQSGHLGALGDAVPEALAEACDRLREAADACKAEAEKHASNFSGATGRTADDVRAVLDAMDGLRAQVGQHFPDVGDEVKGQPKLENTLTIVRRMRSHLKAVEVRAAGEGEREGGSGSQDMAPELLRALQARQAGKKWRKGAGGRRRKLTGID